MKYAAPVPHVCSVMPRRRLRRRSLLAWLGGWHRTQ